jgi:hypothetical protein
LALDSLFRQQLNANSYGPYAANSSIWTNEQKYAIQVVTQYPGVRSLKIEKKAVGSQRSARGRPSGLRKEPAELPAVRLLNSPLSAVMRYRCAPTAP